MTFKQKIIFIISLAFFQIFYLLSNYTGQYLNSFFLLTCLTAAILCYNLYQLLMQLFTSEKVEAELNLLKKQQLLNSEHLLLMNQQEATSLKAQKQFSEKSPFNTKTSAWKWLRKCSETRLRGPWSFPAWPLSSLLRR